MLQDAKADIPPAMTDSTSQEVAPKIVIAEKSVADNEVESTRPKRGRSTRRYTEYVFVFSVCPKFLVSFSWVGGKN